MHTRTCTWVALMGPPAQPLHTLQGGGHAKSDAHSRQRSVCVWERGIQQQKGVTMFGSQTVQPDAHPKHLTPCYVLPIDTRPYTHTPVQAGRQRGGQRIAGVQLPPHQHAAIEAHCSAARCIDQSYLSSNTGRSAEEQIESSGSGSSSPPVYTTLQAMLPSELAAPPLLLYPPASSAAAPPAAPKSTVAAGASDSQCAPPTCVNDETVMVQ